MNKKLTIVVLLLLLISLSLRTLLNIPTVDTSDFNVLKDNHKEFDFPIHSFGYMMIDLADFEIMYAKNHDVQIYPASLTKVVTLDTVLNLVDDLDETSYVANAQVEYLIQEDASLAYIQRDTDYTLRDLLYALILPSGADAALALENYFEERGIDLIEQMNIQCEKLGCTNSVFKNTTGLHHGDHHTSLNDLFKVTMDVLRYEEGRKILSSLYYMLEDGTRISTGIRAVNHNTAMEVLGGKTGYTPEAGLNIILLYRDHGHPYMLLTCNAMGDIRNDEFWHYDDALTVFYNIYE